MRNTKLIAGLSMAALAALGVAVLTVPGMNAQQDTDKNTKAEKVQIEAEAPEYTGVVFGDTSLLSALQYNVENNDMLNTQTGDVTSGQARMSEAISSYENYVAEADSESTDASVEALDTALQFVPEGSVIAGYINLGVSNVSDYLNIRSAASTEGDIIGKMPGGSACEVIGEEGDWYLIQSGGVTGYVSKEYILTGYDANVKAMETMTEVLRVNCDVLNVRQEPSQDCSVTTQISQGEIMEITDKSIDGWYKILINGLEGYVSADYVDVLNTLPCAERIVPLVATVTTEETEEGETKTTVTYEEETEAAVQESNDDEDVSDYGTENQTSSASVQSAAGSAEAADVINYAYQFLGNPYVYGGNSLTNGIDCSGFVQQIYGHFGYSLPRTSSAYTGVGETVSYSEAQPGDILVYRYGDGSGHVAIYIGDGQVIHASTPKTGICIGSATYTQPYSVQRVID